MTPHLKEKKVHLNLPVAIGIDRQMIRKLFNSVLEVFENYNDDSYQQNNSLIKIPTSSAILFDMALASTNLVK